MIRLAASLLGISLYLSAAAPALAANLAELTCDRAAPTLEALNTPLGAYPLDPEQNTRWLLSRARPARAVVLLIHGLNIKPSRMDSVAAVLTGAGYDVLRVALSGHRGSLKEMRRATHQRWLEETFLSYCVAHSAATRLGVPVHAIGFSVGGALIEDMINEARAENPAIRRKVLFAPALSLTTLTRLAGFYRIFGRNFLLPSTLIGPYRANNWIPMAAYSAVTGTAREAVKTGLDRSNVPTLIFGDSRDELVSIKGLLKLARRFKLSEWKFQGVKISKAPPFKFKLHHIIIDEQAMGPDQWRVMMDGLLSHLGGDR